MRVAVQEISVGFLKSGVQQSAAALPAPRSTRYNASEQSSSSETTEHVTRPSRPP